MFVSYDAQTICFTKIYLNTSFELLINEFSFYYFNQRGKKKEFSFYYVLSHIEDLLFKLFIWPIENHWVNQNSVITLAQINLRNNAK